MPQDATDLEPEAVDRALDLGRFTPRIGRPLIAAMVAGFLVMTWLGWPAVWHVLDTTEVLGDAAGSGTPSAEDGDLAYTRLYTAAYLVSILPFLAATVLYLSWRRHHAAADRLPTPLLLLLAGLTVLQVASIAVAWGEQYTGRAIQELLQDRGISFWGRDVIERGWYAGYAAQVATMLLASSVVGLHARRGWWVFALVFPVVVPATWLLLGTPYVG